MRNYVKLGELYTVHNGLSKDSKFFGKGYPFLSFSTVFNNYFLPDELSNFVQSTPSERENYSIKRGDVFVTRTSETSDELGMSSVALKDYPNATFNGFTKRMRPKDTDRVIPEYIGYYLRMPQFRNGFQAFSTMTTRASLKNDDLLSMQVWLPDTETQKYIGLFLKQFDDLIENNNHQIKLLEEAAKRIYKEWFIDFRFPGYENCKIVDGVPKGWHKGNLLEIARFKRGKMITKRHTSLGNIPVIAGGLEPAYYHNEFNAKGPVLTISGSGANAGFLRLYHQNIWASDCSFIDEENKNIYFIYEYLESSTKQIESLKKGSAQPHVYAKDINLLQMLIPSDPVLKEFRDIVTPFFQNIKNCETLSKITKEARDRLLPKLMSGEIEV